MYIAAVAAAAAALQLNPHLFQRCWASPPLQLPDLLPGLLVPLSVLSQEKTAFSCKRNSSQNHSQAALVQEAQHRRCPGWSSYQAVWIPRLNPKPQPNPVAPRLYVLTLTLTLNHALFRLSSIFKFAFILSPRMWQRPELLMLMCILVDKDLQYTSINQKDKHCETSQNRSMACLPVRVQRQQWPAAKLQKELLRSSNFFVQRCLQTMILVFLILSGCRMMRKCHPNLKQNWQWKCDVCSATVALVCSISIAWRCRSSTRWLCWKAASVWWSIFVRAVTSICFCWHHECGHVWKFYWSCFFYWIPICTISTNSIVGCCQIGMWNISWYWALTFWYRRRIYKRAISPDIGMGIYYA